MKNFFACIILTLNFLGLIGCRHKYEEVLKTSEAGIYINGIPVPELGEFDRAVTKLMQQYHVHGGAVALANDGHLILAHGYGFADVDKGEPINPDSLFRIASVSKPITAVAVMKLVEEGRLNLDDRAFEILQYLEPIDGEIRDQRLGRVTIRHLLEHSGGWDRRRSFDPMDSRIPVSNLESVGISADCEGIIRYMLGKYLQYSPGTRHAYSNFGYCILDQVIEKITGLDYETYVIKEVLLPIGITRMQTGGSLLVNKLRGEVHYYDYPGAGKVSSIFQSETRLVSRPYGSLNLHSMAASGGWIASAIDLIRFILAVDANPDPPDILKPETIQIMGEKPDLLEWKEQDEYYYALGWEISEIEGEIYWSHDGAMPGTRTLVGRSEDGFAAAMLFNTDPKEGSEFLDLLVDEILILLKDRSGLPNQDLFPYYVTE